MIKSKAWHIVIKNIKTYGCQILTTSRNSFVKLLSVSPSWRCLYKLHTLLNNSFQFFSAFTFTSLVCILDLYLSFIASVILFEKTFLHW